MTELVGDVLLAYRTVTAADIGAPVPAGWTLVRSYSSSDSRLYRFSWEPDPGRPTWEQYALLLARAAASRSEDPVHQVGAVILRPDRSVAGLGYNGAPSGVELDFSDVEGRKALVIHAETNALRYTSPAELGLGSLLATTRHPCPNCLTQIAAYGIRTVVIGERHPADPVVPYTDDRDWRTLDRVAAELRLTRAWLG